MKKILSAALAAALFSCTSAPTTAPTTAPATPEKAAVSAAPVEMTYEEALPVSIKSFYANGDPSGTVTFRYNSQGLLTSQETFNANGVLVEARTGRAKGPVWRIAVTNAQSGEIVSYEDRTYGSRGELLVQAFLNASEVVQASNEYAYDPSGRKISWQAKTGSGSLQARTLYRYDAQGNNIKTEVYDSGGVLANVFESTYDDQSQILTRKGFDAASNLVEQTNFTWKDGRKLKEETVKPLLRTLEYTYGDKNAPLTIVSSVRGRVVERQTLEYQWFKKTKILAPKE